MTVNTKEILPIVNKAFRAWRNEHPDHIIDGYTEFTDMLQQEHGIDLSIEGKQFPLAHINGITDEKKYMMFLPRRACSTSTVAP
jgi:hypothetical protein